MGAEEEFAAYDFENDTEWKQYWGRIEIPSGADEQSVKRKYQRKWFKSTKNADLEVTRSTPSTSSSSSQKTSSSSSSTYTNNNAYTSSTSSSSARPTPSGNSTPMSYREASRHIGSLQPIIFMLNVSVILFAIFYIVPVIGESRYNYYYSFYAAMMSYAISLFAQFGRPRFEKDWWTRAMMNANTQYILLAATFTQGAPFLMALMPLCVAAFFNSVGFCSHVLQLIRPDMYQKLAPQFAKINSYQPAALKWNASMETLLFVYLVLQLFSPTRNMLQLVLYAQLSRLRYHTDAYAHQAWAEFAQKLDMVFYHRLCPSVVGTLWTKTKNYCSRLQ
eukprot:TRINITY_DN117_c0_g1::TRINITY_DN117_c0_g1_i1::g.14195::m.14195 TRINITY_DN117_c0_g1::TRINITY_DN117_c0_g1_i1::g.14195  ORF type:complete len:351 (+),score=38.47,sp/Q54ME7/TMM33_DICDI/24.77/4e-12,UPF0121/PF03661.8/2.3e-19,Pex14_N/PF04695.8/0.022,DUF912/PF06024.7/0.071,SSP160/PF06933.6/0.99,Syntaphilin/PF15290.1/1.9,RAP1/PF07218.6/4.8 TRINITY_DN117_c0_g1_i1:56-1054(+)